MGNDSSLLRHHIDHAKKTGVCVLKDQKLSEVSLIHLLGPTVLVSSLIK